MALSDISLTSGMRGSLLSLQGISKSIDHTQERLSTGRKVNSALDNPTNFFASQAHTNRASDLNGRKDGIREAIQQLFAANNGITAISSLLEAAKGLGNAALGTADQASRDAFSMQFDETLSQINTIANDSNYRGTNLLKSDSLNLNFSESTNASTLNVTGVEATNVGLLVSKANSGGTPVGNISNVSLVIRFNPNYNTLGDLNSDGVLQAGEGTEIDFKMVNDGTATAQNVSFSNATISTGWSFAFNASANLGNVTAGSTVITDSGSDLDLNIPAGTNGTQFTISLDFTSDGVTKNLTFKPLTVGSITNGQVLTDGAQVVEDLPANPWSSTANIQKSIDQVDSAITTMRSTSKSLASNSNILTTRLSYTDTMMNILQTGADNLTLADMNAEGANMLMLQTRQSLGTTSLSMGAQAAQSVMRLF